LSLGDHAFAWDKFSIWRIDSDYKATLLSKNEFRRNRIQTVKKFKDKVLIFSEELWEADKQGLRRIKDINPGPKPSSAGYIANDDDTAYFWANDPLTGNELWRTDGTEKGTTLVYDSIPGAAGSTYGNGIVHSGKLYFAFGKGTSASRTNINELYVSDGTKNGTKQIWSGETKTIAHIKQLGVEIKKDSVISDFVRIKNHIFFISYSGRMVLHIEPETNKVTYVDLGKEMSSKLKLFPMGNILFITSENDGIWSLIL